MTQLSSEASKQAAASFTKNPKVATKGKKTGGGAPPSNESRHTVVRVADSQLRRVVCDTHNVQGEVSNFLKNDHEPAAATRQISRDWALRLARRMVGDGYVVICYPSQFEEQYAAKNPKTLLYRDFQTPEDVLKGLNKHQPKLLPTDKYVFVANDVYQADWNAFFASIWEQIRKPYQVILTGFTLAGRVGVNIIGEKVFASYWEKEGEIFHCKSVGSEKWYSHRDDRWFLQANQGVAARRGKRPPLYFVTKSEHSFDTGREGHIVHITNVCMPDIPKPKATGLPGVVVDEDGLVPSLFGVNWPLLHGRNTTPNFLENTAYAALKEAFGVDFLFTIRRESPSIAQKIDEAVVRTVNHLSEAPRPQIQMQPPVVDQLRFEAFAKEAEELGPFAALYATLAQRNQLTKTLLNAFVWIKTSLLDLWTSIKSKFFKDREYPANVVFNLGGALGTLARSILPKSWTRARNMFGRASNLLRRPWTLEGPLGALLSALSTAGTVILETIIRAYGGRLLSLFQALLEVVLVAVKYSSTEDTSLDAFLAALVTATLQTVLLVMPVWLSIPIQLFWDAFQTGVVDKLVDILRVRTVPEALGDILSESKRSFASYFPHLVSENGEIKVREMESFVHLMDRSPSYMPTEALVATLNDKESGIRCRIKFKDTSWGKITKESFERARAIRPRKEYEYLLRLVPVPVFKATVLTHSDVPSALQAVCRRYAYQLPPPLYLESKLEPLVEEILMQFRGTQPVHVLSLKELDEHMVESNYPYSKRAAYLSSVEDFNNGKLTFEDLEKEQVKFVAKPNELLKNLDGTCRYRIVYLVEPRQHAPLICKTVPAKTMFAHMVSQLRLKLCGSPLSLRIPLKGTDEEVAAFINEMTPNSFLLILSGDDSYFVHRRAEGFWTLAADMKSCDTTIGRDALNAGYRIFSALGFTPREIAYIDYINAAPKYCQTVGQSISSGDDIATVKLNHSPMNCSGNSTTTLQTMVTVVMLVIGMCNAAPPSYSEIPRFYRETAVKIGLIIEYEEHLLTEPSGWTPIGSASFLSKVPILARTGQVVLVPKSHTKDLFIKGEKGHFNGYDIRLGLAARANKPELLSDPIGRAMKEAFLRSAGDLEVEDYVPEHYKLTAKRQYQMTIEEHLEFVNRFGFIKPAEYYQELRSWENLELPSDDENLIFPVTDLLARAHYGYQ